MSESQANEEAQPFKMPDVIPGDQILFHVNPADRNPLQAANGWVSQAPGSSTLTVLIWSPTFGFIEKTSVRHVDDPFWRESELAGNWMRWGAWELHPNQKALHDVRQLLTELKVRAAKQKA